MQLQLLRHATFLLTIGEKHLLVDPMLAPAGSMPAVENSANSQANPLIELPFSMKELPSLDGILLTHTHRDHFDQVAKNLLDKNLPVFCQPSDAALLKECGFSAVHSITDTLSWQGLEFFRTQGRHGQGIIGEKMGPVSGYVIKAEQEPTLYVAGDTVWCQEVETTLSLYQPQVTVVFAGAAQFLEGGPITMTKEDVASLCRHAPHTQVAVFHMEAFNHCLLTRQQLKEFLFYQHLREQVWIPENGDSLSY